MALDISAMINEGGNLFIMLGMAVLGLVLIFIIGYIIKKYLDSRYKKIPFLVEESGIKGVMGGNYKRYVFRVTPAGFVTSDSVLSLIINKKPKTFEYPLSEFPIFMVKGVPYRLAKRVGNSILPVSLEVEPQVVSDARLIASKYVEAYDEATTFAEKENPLLQQLIIFTPVIILMFILGLVGYMVLQANISLQKEVASLNLNTAKLLTHDGVLNFSIDYEKLAEKVKEYDEKKKSKDIKNETKNKTTVFN